MGVGPNPRRETCSPVDREGLPWHALATNTFVVCSVNSPIVTPAPQGGHCSGDSIDATLNCSLNSELISWEVDGNIYAYYFGGEYGDMA